MDANRNFFRTAGKALHPGRYDELSERRTKDAAKYFFSIIFVAFILFVLISIPLLLRSPQYFHAQLGKFERLNVSIDAEMSEAVRVTDRIPFLLVDTRIPALNQSDLPGERYVITEKFFYVRESVVNPFSKEYRAFPLGGFKDVLENKAWYANLLTLLLVLMVPSLLLILYLYFVVKYLLLILAASLLGLIVARLAKFDITFARLCKVGMYAVTPAVVLELIGFLFHFNQYLLHYLLFLVLFILGAVKSGEVESVPKRKKPGKIRKGKYIDLGKEV